MSDVKWLDILGWSDEQVMDLRFVGYAYLKQGHYDLAIKFFEALVVLCPQSAYDLQSLGALYLEVGDNLKALTYLNRALQENQNHAPTLLNRAKALLLLGYHRQGLQEVSSLQAHDDQSISGQAQALYLSYS